MPRIHAALVDLDGTLVDTLGDFEVALARTLADLGAAAVPREFIERTVGRGSEHLIRSTLAERGLSEAHYEQAWARYQHHYLAINGLHARACPGAVEALERWAAAGWRLACLTNKPQAFAEPLLERLGLGRWFEAVYGGDAFPRRKPDPLPLLEACRRFALPTATVLMVGDSRNDAQAARAAGCPVVLVRGGYNHGEPVESAGADAVVDRLDHIDPEAPTAPRRC